MTTPINLATNPSLGRPPSASEKKAIRDTLDISAELLVELKLRSVSQNNCEVVDNPGTVTSFHRQDIIGEWNPVEVTDPQGCWEGNTFTAPSTGLYLFDISRADFSVKARAPNAATVSLSHYTLSSLDYFSAAVPRGSGLVINGVPYVLTDVTNTSRKFSSMSEVIVSYAVSENTSPRSSWSVHLTENDTCKLATMMPFAGSATSTSITGLHAPRVTTASSIYARAHRGPVDSPIKIYKLS